MHELWKPKYTKIIYEYVEKFQAFVLHNYILIPLNMYKDKICHLLNCVISAEKLWHTL